METAILKTCPVCHSSFTAHPSAIYCKPRCAQRAKYQRRIARVFLQPANLTPALRPSQPTSVSQYERILKNPTPEELIAAYQDISRYNYEREFRIEPLPLPDVPKPPDVVVDDLDDHAIAYHASRSGPPPGVSLG